MTTAPPHENGNALFLILIVVILFAALSYAGTQSLRTSTKNPQEEGRNVRGIEMIQYATFVSESLMRMKFRGIAIEELCFDFPLWGHANYNHAGCSAAENHVFNSTPDSGGVIWMRAPQGANLGEPWYFTGQTCIPGIGGDQTDNCHTDGSGATEDLVMILPNITLSLCLEVNNQLGIINPGGVPPKAQGDLWPAGMPVYAGTFSDGGRIDSGGSGDLSILRGHEFGCVEGNGTPPAGTYAYYHVLLKEVTP